MSWNKLLRRALFGLGLAISSAALPGTIVIRASGPSASAYPAGRALPDGQRIALRAGDTLTLLDARGTRVMSGPGNFDVGALARTTTAPSALAALIGNAGTRQVRTGAVRGGVSGPSKPTSLWYIDTARSGTVCLKDMTRATLWRASMAEAATLTLSARAQSVPVVFAGGQVVRAWPVAELPLSGDTEYRIAAPGAARPATIRFALIDARSDAPDDIAAALIAKGCRAQLDQLVEAGRSAPETPAAAANAF